MFGLDFAFLLEKTIISVFAGLKSMFHVYAQSFSFSKSAFISTSRLFLFLNLFMRATSSANMNMSDFMPASISIKYIKNKSDESIDPCGTEPKIFIKSDVVPP